MGVDTGLGITAIQHKGSHELNGDERQEAQGSGGVRGQCPDGCIRFGMTAVRWRLTGGIFRSKELRSTAFNADGGVEKWVGPIAA
jgi:hypothetical protein